MNDAKYQTHFFASPPPKPRFQFDGGFSIALFFADYEPAVDYYSEVLGPPTYVEGEYTRSWQIGPCWLTLLKGQNGSPQNMELIFQLSTPAEAEKLQQAFIQAGGVGPAPSDQIMHIPVRYCPVCDPFGTDLLLISPLNQETNKS